MTFNISDYPEISQCAVDGYWHQKAAVTESQRGFENLIVGYLALQGFNKQIALSSRLDRESRRVAACCGRVVWDFVIQCD